MSGNFRTQRPQPLAKKNAGVLRTRTAPARSMLQLCMFGQRSLGNMRITMHENCQTVAVTVEVTVAEAVAVEVAVTETESCRTTLCHRVPDSQPVQVDYLTVAAADTERIVWQCYHRGHTTSRESSVERKCSWQSSRMNSMHELDRVMHVI